ncbi:hypothetical protein OG21DRAFT_1477334 [Imleria badia]|nr:hypothetical protein OG21DRAFT_1477334 [Imleria badia]
MLGHLPSPEHDPESHKDNGKNLVRSSIKELAITPQMLANTHTSVSSAENLIVNPNVMLPHDSKARPFCDPKHRRDLLWHADHIDPLPQPSVDKCSNAAARTTLLSHPYLFKIVTPALLVDHPNQPFVCSVCYALCNGFWPWAETVRDEYPTTSDHPNRPAQQFRAEEDCLRFSPLFGPHLLPGMYSVPVHALCMVVDHSAGSPSLNDIIDWHLIAGTKMDGMRSLGASLLGFREEHPDAKLVIFKLDVSMAYHRLPMHPLWQMKQIVTISNGDHYIWVSFMCLVIWIAIYVKHLAHMKAYVDDSYSFEQAANMKFYTPYNKWFPAKQTDLLMLWDEIGLPHEELKQVFGDTLEVIGFIVDPNAMFVLFPESKRTELLKHIHAFAVAGKHWPLREFLRLAGWCNWAFNVFFLLPPGLSALYEKVSGKSNMYAGVTVNTSIVCELTWLADHVKHLPGVRLFNACTWKPSDPDVTVVFVDVATSGGLGVFFPDLDLGLQCAASELPSDAHLNFLELLTVTSAIHAASLLENVPRRLAVFLDSTFAVDVLSSLHVKPPFNNIVISSVDILIAHDIDLHVFHVAGEDNTHNTASSLVPGISILSFQPPRDVLGVGSH